MQPISELVERAARLAARAPQEWSQFLEAVEHYSTKQTTDMRMSSLDELPRAQGRAQVAAHLYDTLANATKRGM